MFKNQIFLQKEFFMKYETGKKPHLKKNEKKKKPEKMVKKNIRKKLEKIRIFLQINVNSK